MSWMEPVDLARCSRLLKACPKAAQGSGTLVPVTFHIFLKFSLGQELLIEHRITCVQLRAGALTKGFALGTSLGAVTEIGRERRRLSDAVPLFLVLVSLAHPFLESCFSVSEMREHMPEICPDLLRGGELLLQ